MEPERISARRLARRYVARVATRTADGTAPATEPARATLTVAFDSRPAGERHGIGRYVRCLLEALGRLEAGTVVETHRPKRADVFHTPWLDGALLHSPCPMVVTLHDVVALKRPGEFLRTGRRLRLRFMAARRAVRIIVPTQAVAADVQDRVGVPDERIAVIHEAVSGTLQPRAEADVAAARARYGLPERYLLWVGGLKHPNPHKRVAELAAAPRSMPLVLVGEASRWARELDGVILTGHVPDADLAAIYSGAHALVFPSDDEGFGLPPVEALACGAPVVACDVAAVREVLGDRATFVECGDLAGLLAAGEAARRPAPAPPAWTWTDAARATWAVYEAAAASPGRRLASRR
jgi:glycosyltransferase involved in cell wall biosynthesis